MLRTPLIPTALAAAACVAVTGAAAPALAYDGAPGVRVEEAAARLVVIPEARGDVSVSVRQGDPRLPPLRTHTEGNVVVVEGGLARRIRSCGSININVGVLFHHDARPYPGERVIIDGVGPLALDHLPVITARVPLNAGVAASGAVWGDVGPSASLHLAKDGCGDFHVADVRGAFDLASHGSGDVEAGRTGPLHAALHGSGDLYTADVGGEANLSVDGSGDVKLGRVAGPIAAHVNGSGDVTADEAQGSISVAIRGSGDVHVKGGRAPNVAVQVAGSGDFSFGGEAGSLAAQVAGSGDVHVAHVAGTITKSVAGSGEVTVGR